MDRSEENLWLELVVSSPVLFVTNDFGPRAGGIETFVIGLIERRPFGQTIVYTSAQAGSEEYDKAWKSKSIGSQRRATNVIACSAFAHASRHKN